MISAYLCMFIASLALPPGNGIEIVSDSLLQPGLIQEFYNVFNNLSNLALLPHLMKTPDCRRDCEAYRQAFLQNKMWAAEMFDANGRPSLGVLNGNLYQVGNIKQCVYVSSEMEPKIEGKFCIINFYINPRRNNSFVTQIWKRMFDNMVFTSKPYEGTIAPGNNVIVSSVCIPSSCTAYDLATASGEILSIFNRTNFEMEVHVDNLGEERCTNKQGYAGQNLWSNFVGAFGMVAFVLVCCATVVDSFLLQNVQKNERDVVVVLSRSFSLKRNLKELFDTENGNDSLGSLNGLKCLSCYLLFLCHYLVKFVFLTVDRSDVLEIMKCPLVASVLKNATSALDLLFFLSGIAHSYKITKFLQKGDHRSLFKSILFRYTRFLILVYVFHLFGPTSSNQTIASLLYLPKKNRISLWRVIFCVENFYGLGNMVLPITHSFYTDFQLYLIGCLTLTVGKHRRNKIQLLSLIAIGSLFCRSVVLYFYPTVQPFLMLGRPLQELINMMSFMHMAPFGRLPFYMSGLTLGYYLRRNREDYSNLASFYQKIGWILALICFFIALILYYPMNSQYEYKSSDGAVISFIHSFCLATFLIWSVWYSETFQNSLPYRFLNAGVFVILNRLSTYFSSLHLLVIYVSMAYSRYIFELKISEVLGLDYILLTILLSGSIMLFIHLPLKNVWKYYSIKNDTAKSESKRE